MDHDTLFAASVGGLAVAAAAAVPAVFSIASQIRSRAPKDNFYEDQDGVATPESIAAFSNKPSKFAIAFLAASTAGLSLAVSVLSTLDSSQRSLFLTTWLTTAAWVSPRSVAFAYAQTVLGNLRAVTHSTQFTAS